MCKCGSVFVLTTAAETYAGGEACCDVCRGDVSGTDLVYHCPKGFVPAHNGGADTCAKCVKHYKQTIKDDTASHGSSISGIMYDHLSNLAENALSHSNSRVDRDESSREKKTNMNSLLAAVALIQQQQKYNTHDKSKRGTNTRQSTIIEQKQSHSFEEMINYQEYIVNDRTTSINGLRQDNKDLMTFPNGSNERQLNQLTKHGLKDFYDLQVYLPSLMIVANSLNEPFQKTMKNMIVNNSEMGNGCLFKAAPIKQLSRAQAKAESDYAACPFPTSSHVLDLIRCSLVYDDCDSLMSGIKTFRKIIQQDVKNGCVKQVVRIKNMFLQNKKENPNGNAINFIV